MWVPFTVGGLETVTVSLVVVGSTTASIVFSASGEVSVRRSPGIDGCPNTSYSYIPVLIVKSRHLYPSQGAGA